MDDREYPRPVQHSTPQAGGFSAIPCPPALLPLRVPSAAVQEVYRQIQLIRKQRLRFANEGGCINSH